MSSPRALVTGCAGFIGSHLTEALLAGGHEVVGLDCFSDNYPARAEARQPRRARDHDRFELHPVDLATAELDARPRRLRRRLPPRGRAGRPVELGQPLRPLRAQQRRGDAAAARGAAGRRSSARVVYASSSSIYGESERLPTPEDAPPRPLSPYGVTKLAGEQLCRVYHVNHGLETVALRFFTVYGPRQRPDMAFRRFCEAAASGGSIELFGDGRQSARLHLRRRRRRAIRAAGTAPRRRRPRLQRRRGLPISLNGALERLAAIAGRPLDVSRAERESGDVLHTAADVGRARAELGFAPTTTLAAGLRAEYEWVLARAERRPRLAAVSATPR